MFNFRLTLTMSEKRIEELGFKAFDQGFFKEWQSVSGSLLKENPKIDRVEAYEKAFKLLKNKVGN